MSEYAVLRRDGLQAAGRSPQPAAPNLLPAARYFGSRLNTDLDHT